MCADSISIKKEYKRKAVLCALVFTGFYVLHAAQDTAASVQPEVYALEKLFSARIVRELSEQGRIQRSFYGEKNVELELCPGTELCRAALSSWNGENEPVFIVESLYLLKKAAADVQGGGIGKVSAVLRNLSTMTGIQYYSNSRKRRETLYTEVRTVNNLQEQKTVPDPVEVPADGLVSYVYQKDRSLSGCVYRFSYFEKPAETSFRAVNMEKIIYKGFNILKPEHLLLCLNAVETEDHIVFYITVRADVAKIPLVSERLAKSYGSRADAVYDWCLNEYMHTGD